jgi:hypothetical protein
MDKRIGREQTRINHLLIKSHMFMTWFHTCIGYILAQREQEEDREEPNSADGGHFLLRPDQFAPAGVTITDLYADTFLHLPPPSTSPPLVVSHSTLDEVLEGYCLYHAIKTRSPPQAMAQHRVAHPGNRRPPSRLPCARHLGTSKTTVAQRPVC